MGRATAAETSDRIDALQDHDLKLINSFSSLKAVALAISDTHMGNELILTEGLADSTEQPLDPEELDKPAQQKMCMANITGPLIIVACNPITYVQSICIFSNDRFIALLDSRDSKSCKASDHAGNNHCWRCEGSTRGLV